MKVTVDLGNINLEERIAQVERRALSGSFIIISGKHYASFSYRNGRFQRARYDDIKGKEAMERIMKLKKGFLTIDIIEVEKEKKQLWQIIESLPNLLFCGIIEGGIFSHIILKKETRLSEKNVNDFLSYLSNFSQNQKTNVKEIILTYDYVLLYIERVEENFFVVFLLPRVEDIRLLTISIRHIVSRIKDIIYSKRKKGYT